jgi:N-acetylglucosaminyldiphosphoundecaprenol N-acetyl-beta-D-mannosaminyltransferase
MATGLAHIGGAIVEKNPLRELDVRNILGVGISAATMQQAVACVDYAVGHRNRLQIGVVNAAKIVNMRRDETLRRDVLCSDVIFADGMSVVWASKLLRQPLPERVPGIDLMMSTLRLANARGYRIYFLGATDSVLKSVLERVQREFPGAVVAGCRNGFFADSDHEQVARQIAASHADILFIAITSPKKETFMARWSGVMGVPVCHGVGGSFDVYAGKVRRAPEKWQRLGLEWLFRLKQEPRRLAGRYLVTNAMFCAMLGSELARSQVRRLGALMRSARG